MSEKTLEQLVEEWFAEKAAFCCTPDLAADIHRFLQLARREGVRATYRYTDTPNVESHARGLFPITGTVEEPHVEPDPLGLGEFMADGCGRILWRRSDDDEWQQKPGWIDINAQRVELWTLLLDKPTVTREIED